jgi:hypothetical protein
MPSGAPPLARIRCTSAMVSAPIGLSCSRFGIPAAAVVRLCKRPSMTPNLAFERTSRKRGAARLVR